MAQGDGQGISNVRWLRGSSKPHFPGDGMLDLLFACPAGAGDQFFHLGGAVAVRGNLPQAGSEKNHTTGMAHDNSGSRVLVVSIQLFDSHRLGVIEVNHLEQALVERQKACFKRPFSSSQHACLTKQWPLRRDIDHSITGNAKTRIDSKKPWIHAWMVFKRADECYGTSCTMTVVWLISDQEAPSR